MSSKFLDYLRDRTIEFTQRKFIKNVLAVATGIAVAQVISLAFMPFLTRLYGPEAFGTLAAFTAIANIITPLATLGYSNAIVMPDTEDDAIAVARLSLVCAAFVAPLLFIFLSIFQAQLAIWTGLEAAPSLLYLIPVSLLLGAILSVANQMAIREGVFKAKSSSYVASTFLMNIGKLTSGILSPSGLMLIIFSMVGNLFNFFLLLALLPKKRVFELRGWFGTVGIYKAAKEQRDFFVYRMPQSIIRAASMGLPVIMLTALFGAGFAGQYSLILLLLGAPVVLLGDSVGDVFYPKITRAINDRTGLAFVLISKAVLVLFTVGIIPFGFIALFGSTIFPWVFGSEWQLAGQYSQWIAFWMITMLAVRPAVAAMPALKMQSVLLIYEIIVTIARVGALYVGYWNNSDILSIALFSLANVVGYIGLLIVVMLRSRNQKINTQNTR